MLPRRKPLLRGDGFVRIDVAACMGCGVCVAHCPQESIELVRDPAKGEPLEIQRLIAQASESRDDK